MKAEQPADLVIIQMGGNDHRHPNEIPGRDYYHAYVELVEDIHSNWPNAIILLMVCLDSLQLWPWMAVNVHAI